jgi:hypothetical protein
MKFALLGAVLTLLASAPAGAQDRCSRETVAIQGTPVTVALCVVSESRAGDVTTIDLAATYSSKDGAFTQRSTIRFIDGEGPARALQSVSLSQIGITGTLHMTLLYVGNDVSMEHALLTPGAVTIK